jgi:hypothetical protein
VDVGSNVNVRKRGSRHQVHEADEDGAPACGTWSRNPDIVVPTTGRVTCAACLRIIKTRRLARWIAA